MSHAIPNITVVQVRLTRTVSPKWLWRETYFEGLVNMACNEFFQPFNTNYSNLSSTPSASQYQLGVGNTTLMVQQLIVVAVYLLGAIYER